MTTKLSDEAKTRLEAALDQALETVDFTTEKFARVYPDDVTVDGFYPVRDHDRRFEAGTNYGWTTSFWVGALWVAYELTGDDKYRKAALAHLPSFTDRAERHYDTDHHDLGFLYTLASVIPAELFPQTPEGDEAKATAIMAAELLMRRYLDKAGIIQSWGDLSDENERGRAIIDSLMNMPLLYWATEATGDSKFHDAADTHIKQLANNIVRDDNTTHHTYHFDPVTGEALHGSTAQGASDDSCWARGQAWGVYGFALAYRRTEDPLLLEKAVQVADHYIAQLPDDFVPYWDMIYQDGDGQPRDSSSAAIAACGLLELADLYPKKADEYRKVAVNTALSLAENYAPTLDESDALLGESVYSLPQNSGVEEGSLWGDYFYMELLGRLLKEDWEAPWHL